MDGRPGTQRPFTGGQRDPGKAGSDAQKKRKVPPWRGAPSSVVCRADRQAGRDGRDCRKASGFWPSHSFPTPRPVGLFGLLLLAFGLLGDLLGSLLGFLLRHGRTSFLANRLTRRRWMSKVFRAHCASFHATMDAFGMQVCYRPDGMPLLTEFPGQVSREVHFPMQKRAKIRPRMSSVETSPSSSDRLRRASRTSRATSSTCRISARSGPIARRARHTASSASARA